MCPEIYNNPHVAEKCWITPVVEQPSGWNAAFDKLLPAGEGKR